MADENKKAIIKSEFNDAITEINETIDNLLYDKGVFRTFPFQMLMDAVNAKGVTTGYTSYLSLDVNGELIDTLDANVYFEGTLKLINKQGVPLIASTLANTLTASFFMTDCANTGTTATTTNGIQTNILSRWRQVDTKFTQFGGYCKSFSYITDVNINQDIITNIYPLIFFHINYDKIIIKGFKILPSDSESLTLISKYLNYDKELSIPVKIPLFKPKTITYE